MGLKQIGDTITWTFPQDHGTKFSGKTYSAEVVGVDFEEDVYLVYTEYGQDKIPFDAITPPID